MLPLLQVLAAEMAPKSHCAGRPRHSRNPSNYRPGTTIDQAVCERLTLTQAEEDDSVVATYNLVVSAPKSVSVGLMWLETDR